MEQQPPNPLYRYVLARQIVGVEAWQRQRIIHANLCHPCFDGEPKAAVTRPQLFEKCLVKATIGVTYCPLLSNAELLQELKRSIDFHSLCFRRNVIQPGMAISMAADVHSMALKTIDLLH